MKVLRFPTLSSKALLPLSLSTMGFGNLPPAVRHRVVVTGLGCVTPLGHSVPALWSALTLPASQQRTATHSLTQIIGEPWFLPSGVKFSPSQLAGWYVGNKDSLQCQVVASVARKPVSSDKPDSDVFSPTSREARYQRFADAAVDEALGDAGWLPTTQGHGAAAAEGKSDGARRSYPSDRVGVVMGVAIPSLNDIADTAAHVLPPYALPASRGANPTTATSSSSWSPASKRISPFFVPKILANLVAGNVAIRHGFQGPNLCSVSACATGAHCIMDAARLIATGECDAAVAGATEACINPVSLVGFSRMKALATAFNDRPSEASRPFDAARDGFIMGEGSGVMVLERLDVAKARGAKIYCELRGAAATGDAHHISAPHPQGTSVQRCIRLALERGGVAAEAVGYLNAHATSTPLGDELELAALTAAFQDENKRRAAPLLVSSSKGHLGHLLGAAGSVEAIVAVLSLVNRLCPPTANLCHSVAHDPRVICLVTGDAAPLPTTHPAGRTSDGSCAVMSTSFGFGGTNAALLFADV